MDNIRSILSKINRPENKKIYKILTFPTHEGYQTLLDKTGHIFYMMNIPNKKVWETKYRPVPANHEIVPFIYDEMSDIDFILSHERFGQLQLAMDISRQTRIPILHMEHVEPQDDRWTEQQQAEMRSVKGDMNVFITNHNKGSWGYSGDGVVIPHGVDTDVFQGWHGEGYPDESGKYVLYTVNQLAGRDYFCGHEIWKNVRDTVNDIDPSIEFKLVGDNPGVSYPISDIRELAKYYNGCSCYLNTSQLSPFPMTLLEAMSCGCPVVSSSKQEIPSVLNGKNGFCSNNIEDMASEILDIVKN